MTSPHRYPPNVLSPNCPSRRALDLIANKWTLLVLIVLLTGSRRFLELQREVGGVSQKMLTQTLRTLEGDGLVSRTVHPTTPPTVEYALTPLGETLRPLVLALRDWAETHISEIDLVRETPDGVQKD